MSYENTFVAVKYTPDWTTPPETGILSDNGFPIHQIVVYPGESVEILYPRDAVRQWEFGFLSIWRNPEDPNERCDLGTGVFEIPAR